MRMNWEGGDCNKVAVHKKGKAMGLKKSEEEGSAQTKDRHKRPRNNHS